MRYRPDVDGLRALAIIPVVMFHLGFRTFRGGFVGVDVFFVISGFLITGLIYGEMRAGTFSFARFYERRIRRLFPALVAVTVATVVVGALVMLPSDLQALSRSVAATSIFGVNFLAWTESGYFDLTPEIKPLLHAWSLAVEEQFYLTYPIALLLAVRFFPRRVPLAVVAVAVLSLVASLVWIDIDPDAVFYMPFFRAWELMVGALLAMKVVPQAPPRVRDALSLVGVAMICYAVVAFSGATAFPGANALYPVLGTAAVIYAGVSGPSLVGRLLALRPFVFVGLISYSLYLWHWPLIVFTRYWLLREPTTIEKLILGIASVVLAIVSWRYVERPFRGASGVWSRPTLFKAAALSILILVAAGLAGDMGGGLPGRLPPDVVRMAGVDLGRALDGRSCFNPPRGAPLAGLACRIGGDGAPSFLLWGDSHGLVLSPAVDAAAKESGATGLFIGNSGCPPLIGIDRYDPPERGCPELGDRVLTLLDQHPGIRRVILAGRWSLNADGRRYPNEGGPSAVISPNGVKDNPRVFREALERTLRYFGERGIEVTFVAQVPEVGWEVPSLLARARLFGRETPPPPSFEAHLERQHVVMDALARMSGRYSFQVVEPSSLLCSPSTCAVEWDGLPLYADGHHLNRHGSMFVSPLFEPVFSAGSP